MICFPVLALTSSLQVCSSGSLFYSNGCQHSPESDPPFPVPCALLWGFWGKFLDKFMDTHYMHSVFLAALKHGLSILLLLPALIHLLKDDVGEENNTIHLGPVVMERIFYHHSEGRHPPKVQHAQEDRPDKPALCALHGLLCCALCCRLLCCALAALRRLHLTLHHRERPGLGSRDECLGFEGWVRALVATTLFASLGWSVPV